MLHDPPQRRLCERDLAEVEEDLRLKAKASLDRMLEMASSTVGKGDLGKV